MFKSSKNLSKGLAILLKYLVATLFIFIPLYPKFPLFFLPHAGVAIRSEDFLLAITGFILILIWLV